MATPADQEADLPMRVGLGQFMEPTPERLRYCRQLGVEDVLLNMYQLDPDYPHMPDAERMPLEAEAPWSLSSLEALRDTVADAGLRLHAVENLPISFYDDVMLGGPDAEAQLDRLAETVANVGKAGIPYLGYHWMPSGVWRTGEAEVRGGATSTAFDAADADDELTHDREYTEAEMWADYERFAERILPVAAEHGVTMCLHPNDPPVETLGGVPQLFRNFENFDRAMELGPKGSHALEFCLGCWSEMGEDLPRTIRHFGGRDQIGYVHFRDVTGTVPAFHEDWLDEGNYDTGTMLDLLEEVGYAGLMIPDHTPHLEGDSDWEHRGRAWTVGYLNGRLDERR
ncbi:MAG: mannonate dehydratase [Halobacteriaceae archaeon]